MESGGLPSARRSSASELHRLLSRVASAGLSYGEPVRVGERTVMPIARVVVIGGFGFGPAGAGEEGGGGGGVVLSLPAGFVDAGPDGARAVRAEALGAVGLGALAGALAGALVARSRA